MLHHGTLLPAQLTSTGADMRSGIGRIGPSRLLEEAAHRIKHRVTAVLSHP